jgi:protein gp37
MGVTVEDDQATDRIRDLRKCHSRLKFISFEPLLGPIRNLVLDGIDWVIVGGESGPQARPMEESWAISIRDQCLNEGIPYFFKQWGGWKKKEKGRVLDGRIWDQMPPLVHEQLQDFSRRYFIP